MKKFITGIILIHTILLFVGCQEKYEPSIHEELIYDIRNEISSELSEIVENPVFVEKMDSKNEYDDRGEINDFRIKIHIKDKDERNGDGYTKHELWSIAYRIDQLASKNRLVGAGTSSEGAYNGVYFYIGDDSSFFSPLVLNFFGDPQKTYQYYMTDYYDENRNPVFDGSYREENADEWIHQYGS